MTDYIVKPEDKDYDCPLFRQLQSFLMEKRVFSVSMSHELAKEVSHELAKEFMKEYWLKYEAHELWKVVDMEDPINREDPDNFEETASNWP